MKKKNNDIELTAVSINPVESAEMADLVYVTDSETGITRYKKGKGFIYKIGSGEILKDKKILERINSIVIPPAWTDVWICKKKQRAHSGNRQGCQRKKTVHLSSTVGYSKKRGEVLPANKIWAIAS